jgi:co-chaperonin GroES (HSP10)
MNNLNPINDCVLVELAESYEFVATPDKQYATKTSGVVTAVSKEAHEYLLGRKVFFDEYKDGTQVKIDDKTLAFIKFDEIRGYYGETS